MYIFTPCSIISLQGVRRFLAYGVINAFLERRLLQRWRADMSLFECTEYSATFIKQLRKNRDAQPRVSLELTDYVDCDSPMISNDVILQEPQMCSNVSGYHSKSNSQQVGYSDMQT